MFMIIILFLIEMSTIKLCFFMKIYLKVIYAEWERCICRTFLDMNKNSITSVVLDKERDISLCRPIPKSIFKNKKKKKSKNV